jgi:hypothetical protein
MTKDNAIDHRGRPKYGQWRAVVAALLLRRANCSRTTQLPSNSVMRTQNLSLAVSRRYQSLRMLALWALDEFLTSLSGVRDWVATAQRLIIISLRDN